MNRHTFSLLLRIAILILVGSVGFTNRTWADNVDTLQREAVDLYRQGNYDAAASRYQQIFDKNTANSAALKDWVWMQWLGKHYADMLSSAERLTVLTPQSFDAWLIYARALSATGHKEDALQAFEHCRQLAPLESNVRFSIARIEAALKNYERATSLLEQLIQEDPENGKLYPELASAQQLQGKYPEAEKNWTISVRLFPERLEYRFSEAETHYYGTDTASAIVMMKTLASAVPPYRPANEFLINDAVVRGDLKEAQRLLGGTLSTVTLQSESSFVRLAALYQSSGDPVRCAQTAQRVIDSNPMNSDALYLKGECLKQNHQDLEAAELFQQIIKTNPTSLRAWTNLADSYGALGQYENAITAVTKARTLDPTNPYLLLDHAQYLYAANDYDESQKILVQWISANPSPALPVLLYHGLTPYPKDVLLASPIHMAVDRFDDQMKALHDAGYHSITADTMNNWSHRHTNDLPSNPILISFDDARIDSLRYGDPIIQKYGFTATMFAPLIDVEGNLSGYADWAILRRYQKTGRWDIQAHGARAHQTIPVDSMGHRGLFLINRQWLAKEGRLETVDEWARRITADHNSLKTKMLQHLEVTPIAYSWPEGQYGQDYLTNSHEAISLNLALARRQFDIGFHQDAYGLNLRSRDPLQLTRLEPSNNWSGSRLVTYLKDSDPKRLMLRRLLRQATWHGDAHEAAHWLDETKRNGASSANLLADEARIELALGHEDLARSLAIKSLSLEEDPETRQLLKEIKTQKPLLWEPTLMFQEDNQGRKRWAFYQRFGNWKTGSTGWSVHQLAGVYQETNAQTVDEFNGGVSIYQPLGLYHSIGLDVTGHHLTANTSKDTYSLIGSVRSNWTDDFRTQAEGGRTIFNTARAIDANVIIRYVDLTLFWTPNALWSASLRDHFGDFTDTNHDYLEVLQVSRQTFWQPLKALVRVTGDDMRFVSPNYYSPQKLRDYQAGLDYTAQIDSLWKADLNYLPGVGTEEGIGPQFVQDVDVDVSYQATQQLSIRPEIALSWTPTYRRDTYMLKLIYNFK